MAKHVTLRDGDLNIPEEAKNVLRTISADILDIPNRAKNALASRGVDNVLTAIEVIRTDFDAISGVGNKTTRESRRAIDALVDKIENIEPDQILNVLDARESYFEHAGGDVLEVFPAIIDLYFEKVKSKDRIRNRDILYKRFDLDGQGNYTLEDLGAYYDLTRERVRQVEAKSISELGRLLSGELHTKRWRLDYQLIANYETLKKELLKRDFILSSLELKSFFSEFSDASLTSGEFALFMEILGYVKLPSHIDGFRGTIKACWCQSDRFNRQEIESIYKALDFVFDFVDPVRKFDLTVRAKKALRRKITNESIHIALKSCEEIEVEDELISIKFDYLRNAADKAYRLLSSKNRPLHYSDICKEINLLDQASSKQSRIMTQGNLKNQMVNDDRFKPIGKSGIWGLSTWASLTNVTIVQAIESVLHKSGSPLSLADITKGVKEIRPDASKRSFFVYLSSEPDKFTKVGEDLYALAAWKMAPCKRRKIEKVSNEIFYDVARAIFEQRNPIPLPEFIEKMGNKTGLKEASIRARIKESPLIGTRKTTKRHKEAYADDLNFDLESAGLRKPLLKDRVQNEIRSILYERPNTSIKIGELYQLVSQEVPCQRPTFYQYLDKADDITKYKDGNVHYAVYRHIEEGDRVEINLGEYNLEPGLIARLVRPIAMLDVNNVDIALFELGLIFENELTEYLREARSIAVINVTQKDMRKLSNMIDCVVREGVVTKGHHLETLREERNSRAHGKQPSVEERRNLFNKAHYVAELFIRYIALFNRKRHELIEAD